jgi:DNA uptake protein ComE-like DNA-binding protein
LAIVYAGNKAKTKSWIYWGLSLTAAGTILSSTQLIIVIWLLQIGTACYIKQSFALKTAPKGLLINDRATAQLVAKHKGKIDINTCSKHELVYELGLPIVYANDIELLRDLGYIFTYLEELTELAGIPEKQLEKIAPLVTFSYDVNKEGDVSWRRLNSFSFDQLVACNLEAKVAKKVISERQRQGPYKSLIDAMKRTGFSLSDYQNII